MEIHYISTGYNKRDVNFYSQNKPQRTQKFGLGISFSASLSAFPSSRVIQGALVLLDPCLACGIRALTVFFNLGGIALAGAHDMVGKVIANFVGQDGMYILF